MFPNITFIFTEKSIPTKTDQLNFRGDNLINISIYSRIYFVTMCVSRQQQQFSVESVLNFIYLIDVLKNPYRGRGRTVEDIRA